MGRDVEAFFGDALKELRNRKRLSRPKLASRLHVHPSSIEKWECGDVLPDRARVEELIGALGLSEAERLLLLEAHSGHRFLPSLHNLPGTRNPYFTGREDLLAQLHARLSAGTRVPLTQAISGMGGIGKTQVALEYMYRYQRRHSHLFWVSADSPETMTSEFGRLAQELELPEQHEKDHGKIVRAVQRWLREYVNWVMILDNIEDLGLVGTFIPAGHLGAVVLTTRRKVTEPVAQVLEIETLSEDEGMLLLLKRARYLAPESYPGQLSADVIANAQAITRELGGLPLALDQAGAYIAEVGCTVADYLALLTQEHQALLQRRGSVPTDHPQSVALTFTLAFEQVRRNNEAAGELLKLCAFLAPDAIPLELFTRGAEHLGGILKTLAASPLALDQAFELLLGYSLVQRNASNKTLSLHRLLQVVIWDMMDEPVRTRWKHSIIRALHALFPEVEHAVFEQCERLTPHVLVYATPISEQSILPELAEILKKAADYLRARARYQMAEPLYQLAIYHAEQIEPSHPLLMGHTLHNLAVLYGEQGKYEQAEPLYQRALQLWEQTQGPEHPLVAHLLSNLAFLHYRQGRYDQTEALLQRALFIREQTGGPDHPRVAYPLNNLAELYLELGKYALAEPLFQRVLRIWEQALGPAHPDLAGPLHGLATLYCKLEDYAQAEPLYQRALHIREKALGLEHPQVTASLHGLAVLYREQGQQELASSFFQRALLIRSNQLGPDHLDTAETWHEFAILQQASGQQAQAALFFQQALEVRKHRLGREHPKTQATLQQYLALLQATCEAQAATLLATWLTE